MMSVVKQVPEKKITTLKNLIEMREITLHGPKFDLKISLDTMLQLTMLQPCCNSWSVLHETLLW